MISGSKDALVFYTRIQDFRTTLAHADDDMQKGWGSTHLQNMKNSLMIPPSALTTDIRMVSLENFLKAHVKVWDMHVIYLTWVVRRKRQG